MATQNNTAVSEKLRNGLKINQATDVVPTRIADSIVPVFEVAAEKKVQVKNKDISDAASTVLFTTHTVKKTFLVGVHLTVSKDIVNDGVFSAIAFVPVLGSGSSFFPIRYEPLTAGQFTRNIFYCFPIELAKGSAISITNDEATASIDATGVIYFYEED